MPTKCGVISTQHNQVSPTAMKIANIQKIQNINELRTIVLEEFLHKGGMNKFLDEEQNQIFDFTYDINGDYGESFAEEKPRIQYGIPPFPIDEDNDTDNLPDNKLNIIFPKHMVYTTDDYKLHPEYDKNTFVNIYHAGYIAIRDGIISCGTSNGVMKHPQLAFKAYISAKEQLNAVPLLYDIALCTKYLKQLRSVKCPETRCKIEMYLMTLNGRILYKLKFPRITPSPPMTNTLQWHAFKSALPIIVNRMLWKLLWNHIRKYNFTWKIDYAHARETIVALVMERLKGKKAYTLFGGIS